MAVENTGREDVRSFLQDRLDDIVKDIDIIIVKDIFRVDDLITKAELIDGTYVTVDKTFTVCMIDDFLGTFEPLKDKKIITYTIPIITFSNTEEDDTEYFTNLKNAMEEFVASLIGNFYQVSSNLGYATNSSEYTNTEVRINLNGIEYIKWLTTIYLTKTNDVIVGNQVEYGIRLLDINQSSIGGTNITKAEGFDVSSEETITLPSGEEFIKELTFNIDVLQSSLPVSPPLDGSIEFEILLDNVLLLPKPIFNVTAQTNVFVINIQQNVSLGITYKFNASLELTDFELTSFSVQASFTEGFTEIIPILRGPSKVFEADAAQANTENEVGSIPKSGQYSNELGFYLEKNSVLLREFIKFVEFENYDNSIIYELNTVYFNDIDLNFIRKFLILSCAIDPSLGAFVFVRITIAKPYPILVT